MICRVCNSKVPIPDMDAHRATCQMPDVSGWEKPYQEAIVALMGVPYAWETREEVGESEEETRFASALHIANTIGKLRAALSVEPEGRAIGKKARALVVEWRDRASEENCFGECADLLEEILDAAD